VRDWKHLEVLSPFDTKLRTRETRNSLAALGEVSAVPSSPAASSAWEELVQRFTLNSPHATKPSGRPDVSELRLGTRCCLTAERKERFTLRVYARDGRNDQALVEDVLARVSGAGVAS
jgi:hypothetical protein